MAYALTIAQFKARFVREFIYGSRPDQVVDADVTNGINQASMLFNENLWLNDIEKQTAFGFCAAHFLSLNIQSAGGLSSINKNAGVTSASAGPVSSKTVGPVSLNYEWPERIKNDPILFGFTTTRFGTIYLQLLTPRLVGNVFVVEGGGFESGTTIDSEVAMVFYPTGNFDFNASADIAAYGAAKKHYMFFVADIDETHAHIIAPASGILKAITVRMSSNTLTAVTPVTVFINGVATAITLTLAVGAIYGQFALGNLSIAASDFISIQVDISGSTSGAMSGFTGSVGIQ